MYYVKKFLSCFTSEFTCLQKEEIRIGFANGLSEKQVIVYASCEFNHLQMEQMRLALEHGVAWKDVKRSMHADMCVKKMQEVRLSLESGLFVGRDYVHLCFPIVMLSLLVCLFLTLYGNEKPHLRLKKDTVTLSCGEVFEPMEYIDSFSSYRGQLVLPSTIDTNQPGNHVAVYRLKTKHETLEKILYVIV